MGDDTHRYDFYGLRLDSTRPLPGLRSVPIDEAPVDLRFDFEAGTPDDVRAGNGAILRRSRVVTVREVDGGAWTRFDYDDGGSFLLDPEGREVRILDDPACPPEDVLRFLLGSVTGVVLRRRGLTCLHGAVLARGERAFALIAPSGSGKSTLSAALLQEGCTLISDDVLVLRETGDGFEALPGAARVRLWQDAADALLGDAARTVPLGHSRPKRLWDLSHDAERVRREPCALAAVYHLRPRTDASDTPHFESHEGADLLVALLANTYPNPEHYPLGREVRAREFELLGRLVERLPLRQAIYRRRLSVLPHLSRALVEDFDALSGGTA